MRWSNERPGARLVGEVATADHVAGVTLAGQREAGVDAQRLAAALGALGVQQAEGRRADLGDVGRRGDGVGAGAGGGRGVRRGDDGDDRDGGQQETAHGCSLRWVRVQGAPTPDLR
jgi:hypothetical protein